MAKVTNGRELLRAFGGRNIVSVPDNKWRGGPFYLDAVVVDGAAFSASLITKDAWYGDPSVRAAYSLTNGDANLMEATVQFGAVEVIFTDGAFTQLESTVKDGIRNLYLEANVGGITEKVSLYQACSELVGDNGVATTVAAATLRTSRLMGKSQRISNPIRVNLKNDQLSLKSDADCGFGADQPVLVKLGQSVIMPSSARVDGATGGTCGSSEGGDIASVADANIQTDFLYSV